MPADVAALLVQGVIDDSRLDPDLFLVRFRDPENIVLEKAGISIGTEMTFKASSNESDTPEKLLVGEVTALEKEYDGTGTFTVVRGLDKAHRLQRGRRVACYRQMTVSDVVRKTAQAAGLDAGQIDSTTAVHEQISQGNVSDWEFVRRLAADVGAEVAVGDGKLDFVRPAKADTAPETKARATQDPLVLELGRNLLRMRTLITSAAAVPDVDVRGWDMMHKRAVVGTAPAATTNVGERREARRNSRASSGRRDCSWRTRPGRIRAKSTRRRRRWPNRWRAVSANSRARCAATPRCGQGRRWRW